MSNSIEVPRTHSLSAPLSVRAHARRSEELGRNYVMKKSILVFMLGKLVVMLQVENTVSHLGRRGW